MAANLKPMGDDEPTPPDVEDTDDGGAIVQLETPANESPEGESDFYENLAESISEPDLDKLCLDLLERIEYDKECRKPRDDKYAEGIKRSGLGDEAPGGKAFSGASEAVHPMLSKATVYYQSHCINELMPPNGPVRDDIVGAVTPLRQEKAKRKVAHMNWQFKKQMPEFRAQLERLLSQQPLGGSQYMRLVYDSGKRRPVPTFWPLDDVLLPEGAADFYSAERRTFIDHISQHEYESRIRQGYYRDVATSPPAQITDESEASAATRKVQGLDKSPQNKDGLRDIYIIECLAAIENDDEDVRIAGADPREGEVPKTEPRPYLIEIDPYARKILSIVRNWEEDDKTFSCMHWGVDFPFVPWRGAQSVGMIHLLGSLAGAGTGSLRALLDTAHVQNVPTLLKLKGSNSPGQSTQFDPCQVTEIDGGVAGDDIRKVVMAVPFNPPSTMLYQLLGWCTEEGEALVRTTFENLNDEGAPNMPVGTTLALIEQGLKVLCAIHGRLHAAMDRVIGILHRINRLYITDEEILDDTGSRLAYHADYEGPVDVIPVSDPQIFSDVQRFAQLQIIQQRADLHPDLYDAYKVEKRILERTKIPNPDELLKPIPQIQELNSVNENVAMSLGRPVAAFPEQDHLAHIQVHLSYGECQFLGALPLIAPKFWPPMLQHLAEHIVYWYAGQMVSLTSEAADADIGQMTKIKDKGTQNEIDKTLAHASPKVCDLAAKAFAKIPGVIQQAQQLIAQFTPKPQPDPTAVATASAQAQAKAGADQAKTASQERIAQSQQQSELLQTQIEQQGDSERTAAELQQKTEQTREDNATALEIAAAKVETGHSTSLSDGQGITAKPTGV